MTEKGTPRYIKFTLHYDAGFDENIWLKVLKFDGEFYYGMVANNSVACDVLKVGDMIKVPNKEIIYLKPKMI